MTLNVMPCFLKQKRRSLPPLCSSAFIRYCYSSSLCCSSSSNIFLWRFFMSCVYHMSMSIAASIISRWRIQQLKSSKLLASGVFSASISVSAYPSVMTIPGFPFPLPPLLLSASETALLYATNPKCWRESSKYYIQQNARNTGVLIIVLLFCLLFYSRLLSTKPICCCGYCFFCLQCSHNRDGTEQYCMPVS